jgi:hypothetical protein
MLKSLLFALFLVISTVPARAADFLLFYANDVRGETEPCG